MSLRVIKNGCLTGGIVGAFLSSNGMQLKGLLSFKPPRKVGSHHVHDIIWTLGPPQASGEEVGGKVLL